MAACLYLLARILFRRRLVAGLVGAFVAPRRDALRPVADRHERRLRRAVHHRRVHALRGLWTGWWRWRHRPRSGWRCPSIGVLLGLALASKWVAAYAIGALVLLLLVRSALGRVVAILGLIGITSVLGYIAISVPEGEGIGNVTFLLIMVGLTLVAVVVAVSTRSPGPTRSMCFAVLAPVALGRARVLRALARGSVDTADHARAGRRHARSRSRSLLAASARSSWRGLRVGGGIGYGPLAPPPAPDDPARSSSRRRPPRAAGSGRAGCSGCRWSGRPSPSASSRSASTSSRYLPWALIENHQLWPGFPAGHTGQTLVELTAQMYGYHNGLTSPHPASSPWWAWPFDLKPVWFYQDWFAGRPRPPSTTRATSSSGGSGVAAMVFVVDHGVSAPQPGPRPHRHRVRGAVGAVGPHRPRRVPVPLLHGPAVRDPRARLLRRPSCGTGRRAGPGCAPGSRPGWPSSRRRSCGSCHGRCAPSSASNR